MGHHAGAHRSRHAAPRAAARVTPWRVARCRRSARQRSPRRAVAPAASTTRAMPGCQLARGAGVARSRLGLPRACALKLSLAPRGEQKGVTKLKNILEGLKETQFDANEYMNLYTCAPGAAARRPKIRCPVRRARAAAARARRARTAPRRAALLQRLRPPARRQLASAAAARARERWRQALPRSAPRATSAAPHPPRPLRRPHPLGAPPPSAHAPSRPRRPSRGLEAARLGFATLTIMR